MRFVPLAWSEYVMLRVVVEIAHTTHCIQVFGKPYTLTRHRVSVFHSLTTSFSIELHDHNTAINLIILLITESLFKYDIQQEIPN